MKQLKIISDNYDSTNGLIQVNFNEPIIVEPNSTIAMDKFSMEVSNGITDDINLGNQVVFIYTDLTNSQNIEIGALIPAGQYANIQALLLQMNQSFNSILDSDLTYNLSNTRTPDNGLFFFNFLDTTSKTSLVTLAYGSAAIDYTTAHLSLNDMTMTGAYPNSILEIDASGSFSAISELPVVRGALDCRFQVLYSENTASYNFSYGLYDITTNELIYGIVKAETSFFIHNDGNDILVDLAPFIVGVAQNQNQHQFFVEGGDLFYQILDENDELLYRTPRSAFKGFNFNTSYDFAIGGDWDGNTDTTLTFGNVGAIYQPNVNQDTYGIHWDFASFKSPRYLKTFSLNDVAPLRVIQYSFSQAQVLQYGLGFQSSSFQTGSPAISGESVADNSPSFESYYNLALQIPSLQLESYVAKTGGVGGRQNNLCYFFPTLTGDANKSFYTYENRELAFVNLSNKQTINMNSMQFRVVYVSDNSPVEADAISFNLYIKEQPSL